MDQARLTTLARRLDHAWANAEAIDAPSKIEPRLSIDEAYNVQEMVIGSRLDSGRTRAGWKLGLTSAQPPATPIVGTLLDTMIVRSGSELALSSMVSPMVEAEVVVRIGETIDRPQTLTEISRGPHEVGPGIEVIDYRTAGSSEVVDWIADNSTVAYAVVGDFAQLGEIDPATIEAKLSGDGSVLGAGSGSQVMGNPLAAVAWLSGHLATRGHPLEKGQIVLTGSLTGHHPVPEGGHSRFSADFEDLGMVDVRFRP